MDPNLNLRTKIFADGADLNWIFEMYNKPYIQGFTTNPTLMCKAGITDYKSFACNLLKTIVDKPVSFEVFSDDFSEMERQAKEIATWGNNVYVKIPVTNTLGKSSYDLIHKLSYEGIKINVTAVMTHDQFHLMYHALRGGAPSFISVFAGRVADTGVDPKPIISKCLNELKDLNTQVIWASPREILNIFQANEIGCHIITLTEGIIQKLNLIGKDLNELSCDTVKMFFDDGKRAGFKL